MTLQELLAELAKLPGDDVVRGLQEHVHGVFQTVFDRGHKVATDKATAEKTKLEADVAAATDKATAAEAMVASLKQAQPDVAKIHEQYKEEIRVLKKKHEDEVTGLNTQFASASHGRAVADLRSRLVSVGIDADYAAVLAEKPEVQKRLKVDAKGTLEVLQDGKDIPLQAGDGKDALDLMAAELKGKAPAKFITASTDRGSGAESGKSGGKGSVFTRIREEVKSRVEADAKGQGKTLDQRLGARPPA